MLTMSIVWRRLHLLAPGAASMFLLITTLYWLGFGLLALTVARRSVGAGLLVRCSRPGAAGLHAASSCSGVTCCSACQAGAV